MAPGRGCGQRRSFPWRGTGAWPRSEEHTSELQSHSDLVCRLLLEKKKTEMMTLAPFGRVNSRPRATASRPWGLRCAFPEASVLPHVPAKLDLNHLALS